MRWFRHSTATSFLLWRYLCRFSIAVARNQPVPRVTCRGWLIIVCGLSYALSALPADNRSVHLNALTNTLFANQNTAVRSTTGSTDIRYMESQSISSIFLRHWRPGPDDPPTLRDDIVLMAQYFQRYPQVRSLILQLSQRPWQMQYSPKNHSSDVSGTNITVDQVRIFFDPRSAGQFRFHKVCPQKRPFCIASPADLLLHELLHAYQALLKPRDFIAQGGMATVIYPYEHEQYIIDLEQFYYRAMTDIDNHARPVRSEHFGKSVTVACAVCVN